MLLIKIPKNRMNYLIEQVQSHFRPDILERGWEYYHKGRVTSLDLPGGVELIADVAGKAIYRVALNLEHFGESRCDCSFDGCCRHMAAVFFAAYAAHGRPELLLMQLRTAIASRERMQKTAAQKQARLQEKATAQVTPDSLPREWQRFFDQRFHGYTLTQQNSIELFVSMANETLLPFASEWPKPLMLLYELHTVWFIMRKIESFSEHNQSSYLSFHMEQSCRVAIVQCWKQLLELADTIDAKSLAADYPDHWGETMAMAHELLGGPKNEPVSWLTVYRTLWWKLFSGAAPAAPELQRLDARIEQAPGPGRRRDQLVHARAFFDVLAGDDRAAFARYEQQLQSRQLPDFYDVLELLRSEADWTRLQAWLRWLLPTLARARQEEFHTIGSYWEEAIAHQPNDDEWLSAMKALLPRSYNQYSSYLLETSRYRQWVDLQLSLGVMPASLAPDLLKRVESSDPSLLLPLYHLAVEKEIQEKNRNAYGNAIRYLRKLHALYKRIERTDLWSVYMQRLVQKYSRLRAFQEELKKGKWAP